MPGEEDPGKEESLAPPRRWMRQPLSWQRGGAVALAVLFVVMAAALILDSGAEAGAKPIAEYMERRGGDPMDLVEAVGRSARVVLLSDVHGQRGPKRVAAQAIRTLAGTSGLDAVVLEVPSDEQPYLDAYFGQAAEDATVLLSRPRAIREQDGNSQDYLGVYRSIRETNDAVGAARRIRVIAADLPSWPPPEGVAPEAVARLYAQRAEHMLRRLDEELFSLMPDARVLVFVDGYLTLKRTRGELQSAGGDAVRTEWLGELLRQRSASDTRTLLIDSHVARSGTVERLPRYRGTTLYRPLRRSVSGARGVRIQDAFTAVRDPLVGAASPGLRLEILPRGYTLREAADGYIFLPGG